MKHLAPDVDETNYYWHKLSGKFVFNHITKTSKKRDTSVSTCLVFHPVSSQKPKNEKPANKICLDRARKGKAMSTGLSP